MEPVIELTDENEMDIINVTTPFTRICYNELAEVAKFNNITMAELIEQGMSGFMEYLFNGGVTDTHLVYPNTDEEGNVE